MSRPHALAIFRAALSAADPEKAVRAHVKTDGKTLRVDQRRYRLADFDRIQVIGAGKASARMAQALERLLGKPRHRRLDQRSRRHQSPSAQSSSYTNPAILFQTSAASKAPAESRKSPARAVRAIC